MEAGCGSRVQPRVASPGVIAFGNCKPDVGMRPVLALLVFTLFVGGTICSRPLGRSSENRRVNVCNQATGYFHPEKIEERWFLCTPEGRTFFVIGVDAVAPSPAPSTEEKNEYKNVIAKYGDADANWGEVTARRLQHWGFNTLGTYASRFVEPTYLDDRYPADTKGLHSHPTKLPFITLIRPGYYSMKNGRWYLSEPVKDFMYGSSQFYTGYVPSNGVPDYFDAKLAAWLRSSLSNEDYWTELRSSPYLAFLIGIACEDGDQIYGFGAGDQFSTAPLGASITLISAGSSQPWRPRRPQTPASTRCTQIQLCIRNWLGATT